VLVALDEEGRRITHKTWPTGLVKECYMTQEVEALPDGRSRCRMNLAFQPAKPVLSQIMMPLMKPMVGRELRKTLQAFKRVCESEAAALAGEQP
jgi:hypothetical protein